MREPRTSFATPSSVGGSALPEHDSDPVMVVPDTTGAGAGLSSMVTEPLMVVPTISTGEAPRTVIDPVTEPPLTRSPAPAPTVTDPSTRASVRHRVPEPATRAPRWVPVTVVVQRGV